jgi:vitamin B12/bleomycin/antimicrobial peptide transport system ATP-binding/permease protein
LSRPHLAFLDEATSALDEGLQHALYTLICEELPERMLVGVGHRSTLDALHTHHLELLGAGRWNMTVPLEAGAAARRSVSISGGKTLTTDRKVT